LRSYADGESTIGAAVPRVDGRLKVTGQATYTADVDVLGCLWGAILRGPWPHARIARVDVSRARSLAGVRAVLTGADIGGALFGRAIADVPVLCTDRVRFIGDPVAAVAAVDRQTAEEALRLIEVGYEELPAVLDPFAATKPGAPLLHPDFASYRRDLRQPGWPDEPLPDIPNLCSYRLTVSGDLERGFREADLVFEHTYRTPAQHQGYIEPHSCIVSAEPDGTVRVWASTKSPFVLRGLLGFFDGGMLPAANALISSGTQGEGRGSHGTTYGLVYLATGMGFGLGPLSGGFIAAALGLRSVFLITALILLALAVYLPFGVKEPPRRATVLA